MGESRTADDRAPIVANTYKAAKRSKQLFQAEPAAGGGGGGAGGCFVVCWVVDSLSAAKLWPWENILPPTLAPTCNDFFRGVVSDVWCFFLFSLELPSSSLQMDSRMCNVQKCTFWQRGAEPTCTGPERLLWTSAVSDLDIPKTYHKWVSWVFKSFSQTVRRPEQSRSAVRHERRHLFLELVPRSVHFPSQWHTPLNRVTAKGATTTLPIPSPSHPSS